MPSFASTTILISALSIILGLYLIQPADMPSFAAIRAANAAFFRSVSGAGAASSSAAAATATAASNTNNDLPTAVFVGGTSGIGEGMAVTFAEHTEGKSNIILVGRNRAAAERILASLPAPPPSLSPAPAREFVQCDATLLKNVHSASSQILQKYPKINYLIITAGFSTLAGRDETPEGIDKKLAVHYYARWKFLSDLVPGLQKAKEAGEEAVAMSVMAAGKGGKVDLEDLGLKRGYSLSAAALAAPTYNDLMVESFAEKYPSLTFIHAYPGFVRTNLGASSPSTTLRLLTPVALGLFRPLSVSQNECGEYMWYAVSHTIRDGSSNATAGKSGAFRTGSKGEDLGRKGYYGSEEARRRLWAHTVETVRSALGKEEGK